MGRKLSLYGLAINRQSDNCRPHTARMAMQRDIALAFARNLQRLMDHHGLSQAELARKTGVGQSTLSKLLNTEDPSAMNPRSSTVQELADFFDVPGWQMLIPDMPLELLLSKRVTKLIENYRDAPDQGRAQVERVAESEVKYAVAESVLIGHDKAGTGGQ
ncbi:helix-turn-helix domain-containing protein [Rhodanobacter lindaniclasticus]